MTKTKIVKKKVAVNKNKSSNDIKNILKLLQEQNARLSRIEKENKKLRQENKRLRTESRVQRTEYKEVPIKQKQKEKYKISRLNQAKEQKNIIKKPEHKVLFDFKIIETKHHKKFLAAVDKNNKVIDRIPYNKKTIKQDKLFFKNHSNSFDENVFREDRTHVREVHIKTNSMEKGNTGLREKYKSKYNKKHYMYNVSAKDKDGNIIHFNKDMTGRQRDAVASGHLVGTRNIRGERISDDKSRAEAYDSLFRIISAAFSNGNKSDPADGMQIVEDRGWNIEENIIYYENID